MSSSSLGKWVDKLFDDVFYQPDDEFSLKKFEENFSPDLQVRINGESIPRDAYKAVVNDSRAKNELSVQSTQELLVVDGGSDISSSKGTVSHISTFVLKDKQTEAQKEMTSATIITAAWKDGKRVITELTEVIV